MRPLPVGIFWIRYLKFLSIQWVWIKGVGSKGGLLTSATPRTDQNISENVARKVFCVFWCFVYTVSVLCQETHKRWCCLHLKPRSSTLSKPCWYPLLPFHGVVLWCRQLFVYFSSFAFHRGKSWYPPELQEQARNRRGERDGCCMRRSPALLVSLSSSGASSLLSP